MPVDRVGLRRPMRRWTHCRVYARRSDTGERKLAHRACRFCFATTTRPTRQVPRVIPATPDAEKERTMRGGRYRQAHASRCVPPRVVMVLGGGGAKDRRRNSGRRARVRLGHRPESRIGSPWARDRSGARGRRRIPTDARNVIADQAQRRAATRLDSAVRGMGLPSIMKSAANQPLLERLVAGAIDCQRPQVPMHGHRR